MHVTMEDVHVNGYTLPKVDSEMDVVDVDHDYHVHINDFNTLQKLLLWRMFTSTAKLCQRLPLIEDKWRWC